MMKIINHDRTRRLQYPNVYVEDMEKEYSDRYKMYYIVNYTKGRMWQYIVPKGGERSSCIPMEAYIKEYDIREAEVKELHHTDDLSIKDAREDWNTAILQETSEKVTIENE